MNTDPMRDPECTCPWTDESTWTRYGSSVEPGSQREYDPDCPEHGGFPLLEAPASQDVGPPNIGDTCCGKCPGGTCYVDQVTGA